MDINFHYYAIKLLAIKAGFAEDDAQTIAEYSQFIDDYILGNNFTTKSVPPQSMLDKGIARYFNNKGVFDVDCIPTGFDIIRDNANLLSNGFEKKVLTPFHFIPPLQLNDGLHSKFVTIPAKLNDGQIISDLLNDVYNEFIKNGSMITKDILIKIGCLAHVFSDTYAHEGFSGLWIDVNDYRIESCERLTEDTFKDCTEKENTFLKIRYSMLPALGHTTVGHVVDYTNAKFAIKHSKDPTRYFSRVRDNNEYFMQPLQELFKYFSLFTGNKASFEPLVCKFKLGFATNSLNADELSRWWAGASQEIDGEIGDELFRPRELDIPVFKYNKKDILNRLKQPASDGIRDFDVFPEFWTFTEFAYDIIAKAVCFKI